MTLKFDAFQTNALISAGLSFQQAQLYQLLLQLGACRAGRIPRFLDVSRPQAYKLLQELVEIGMAAKNELPGQAALFSPAHPFALEELIRKRSEELNLSAQRADEVMGVLVSQYSTSSSLPGVRILSGVDGMRELYKDILREKSDLQIIRSVKDNESEEMHRQVEEQIKKQISNNIHVRIIGPFPSRFSPEQLTARDNERLVTRRVMPTETFSLPAQVILYNNKVAITALEEPIITTIIDNPAISITLKALFEVIWNTGKELNEMT